MNVVSFKNSPDAQANWLLWVCRSDLKQLKDHDLERVQKDWMEFQKDGWLSQKPPALSRLISWQEDVRSILKKLRDGEPWMMDCNLWRQLTLTDDAFSAQQKTRTLDTDADNKLLVKVMDAFIEVRKDLKICARKKCGKLFVRTKRQAYCSSTCRGTENTSKYRLRLTK